jgi:hypothetical protein
MPPTIRHGGAPVACRAQTSDQTVGIALRDSRSAQMEYMQVKRALWLARQKIRPVHQAAPSLRHMCLPVTWIRQPMGPTNATTAARTLRHMCQSARWMARLAAALRGASTCRHLPPCAIQMETRPHQCQTDRDICVQPDATTQIGCPGLVSRTLPVLTLTNAKQPTGRSHVVNDVILKQWHRLAEMRLARSTVAPVQLDTTALGPQDASCRQSTRSLAKHRLSQRPASKW